MAAELVDRWRRGCVASALWGVTILVALTATPSLAVATPGRAPDSGSSPAVTVDRQDDASGEELPEIDEATDGLEARDGYFPLYWDADRGRLLLEIPRPGEPFLYLRSLATGVGSDELGLDRGTIAGEYIARFRRVGPRVFLLLDNPGFRSTDPDNGALATSVEESFPRSTLAGFEIRAEGAGGEAGDGRLLIDATEFFLRDAVGVRRRLRRAEQGDFRVDPERSSIHLPRTRGFPENTEVEASLTFVGERPGPELRRHVPDPGALTLRQHHSLVKLPPPGFEPRRFDPRVGVFPVTFHDYSRALDEGYASRYAARHRLRKRDPEAPVSEPVEPIVYYMDRGIPEPYRSAFREGAAWWNEVLEAAGFRDAFRIEPMPPEMDPLDARYNVIQWVHRTEAGSSIGPSFVDPRTGEIIKAAVRMDSHRSLVDYDLYAGARPGTGAMSPARRPADGAGAPTPRSGPTDPSNDAGLRGRNCGLSDPGLDWVAALDDDVSAEEFAMARRRQHAAHEVGHTLGLAHNFIAASYGRASVMDYPAPLIRLVDGEIDLSRAYRPGPGAYDEIAVRYAYTQFPEGEEEAGLQAIVDEAIQGGIEFVTNAWERPGSSYPEATTWINGGDPLPELARVMEVRGALIDAFDESAVDPGEPLWTLNRRLVPVYLHHRFTLRAAVKVVGGMEFRYAVRGDPLDAAPATRIVDGERQRRALDLLLGALAPSRLRIPERVLELLAPRPFGYRPDRRAFRSRAEPAFDQIGAARTLATAVVRGLLHPARAARVVAFADRRADLPTLEEVVGSLVDGTWGSDEVEAGPLRRVVERVVLDELLRLARSEEATVEVRAGAEWGLRRIAGLVGERPAPDAAAEAHDAMAAADIRRFLRRRADTVAPAPPLPPPSGTPIGQEDRR